MPSGPSLESPGEGELQFLIILQISATLGGIAGSEIVLTWFGVGVQPPAASFGAMLFEGSGPRTFQQSPHLLLVPGGVVTLLLFAFNLLGDALNDALAPAGVGVLVSAEHLCLAARGARQPGVVMTTEAMRGSLRTDAALREALARAHDRGVARREGLHG